MKQVRGSGTSGDTRYNLTGKIECYFESAALLREYLWNQQAMEEYCARAVEWDAAIRRSDMAVGNTNLNPPRNHVSGPQGGAGEQAGRAQPGLEARLTIIENRLEQFLRNLNAFEAQVTAVNNKLGVYMQEQALKEQALQQQVDLTNEQRG